MGCLMMANANAVIIQAEESPGKFIRAKEVISGYTFETCKVLGNSEQCSPMYNGTVFQRSELNDLSDRNARYALYAVAGDTAAVVGGFFAGMYAGLFVLAYDGAALAAASFLYGGTTGLAAGTTATFALDDLDPFVHRDTSIAYDAIIGVADEGDLEDVDSFTLNGELALIVEDLNFRQLENKLRGQLADIRDMDESELEQASLKKNTDSGLY